MTDDQTVQGVPSNLGPSDGSSNENPGSVGPVPLPPDAVTAATKAIREDGWSDDPNGVIARVARVALTAAAPALLAQGAAAERERIRHLATDKAEKYDDVFEPQHHVAAGALRLFADLLDEDTDGRTP